MNKIFELVDENQLSHHGFIQFAQFGRPHGLKGAFFLKTSDRRTQWDGYKSLLVELNDGFYEKKVVKAYTSGNALALLLEGLNSRNEIEPLYDKRIYVNKKEIHLEENEFIVGALVGFEIYTNENKLLGKVVGVSSYGAQDNLEIQKNSSQEIVLFPFVDQFIEKVDEVNKRINIVYIPEFFEDEGQ